MKSRALWVGLLVTALQGRHVSPGWWARNGDAVVAGLIATVVGGVLLARAGKPYEVQPVQAQGENIWVADPANEEHDVTEPELFRVRLHLKFWSRDSISIENVDLSYDCPSTGRERQWARINGVDIDFDGSYRFRRPVPVAASSSADVIIRREFRTTQVIGNATDYREAQALFELSTPTGLQKVTVSGTLKPGGQLDRVQVRVAAVAS
jgi:hypothetical protein